jgi:hypothetical protein
VWIWEIAGRSTVFWMKQAKTFWNRKCRTVGIKILPAQPSSDPVRKQRFEREAKTISSLNHPHIYVLHDVGSQDGISEIPMLVRDSYRRYIIGHKRNTTVSMAEHCIGCLTGSRGALKHYSRGKGMRAQFPLPRHGARIFFGPGVGQSTVMRVPAVVPLTSANGVPVP